MKRERRWRKEEGEHGQKEGKAVKKEAVAKKTSIWKRADTSFAITAKNSPRQKKGGDQRVTGGGEGKGGGMRTRERPSNCVTG